MVIYIFCSESYWPSGDLIFIGLNHIAKSDLFDPNALILFVLIMSSRRQGSAKSKYLWTFGSLDRENLIQPLDNPICTGSLDLNQKDQVLKIDLTQYVFSWIWLKSSWSNFFCLNVDQVELTKRKIMDQLDLSKIQKEKNWINLTWSKSSTKNIGSTRLDQHPKRKNWINLTWAKSRKNILGQVDFQDLIFLIQIQGAGTFFADPCQTLRRVIWFGRAQDLQPCLYLFAS